MIRNITYTVCNRLTTAKCIWSGFVMLVLVPALYLLAGFVEKLN